eukprot:m51a1_g10925 hypothetical protein (178) ;mRNA; f:113202-113787
MRPAMVTFLLLLSGSSFCAFGFILPPVVFEGMWYASPSQRSPVDGTCVVRDTTGAQPFWEISYGVRPGSNATTPKSFAEVRGIYTYSRLHPDMASPFNVTFSAKKFGGTLSILTIEIAMPLAIARQVQKSGVAGSRLVFTRVVLEVSWDGRQYCGNATGIDGKAHAIYGTSVDWRRS